MSLDRSVFYTAVTQLPSVLLGFVTGVCITRLLQEVGRGYYTVLQSDVVLLSMLVSFNIGSGLLYFLARRNADKSRIIGIACSMVILIGIGLAVALGAAWSYGVPTNPLFPNGIDSFPYFAYVISTVFFSMTHSLFHAIFSGLRLFRVVNQMTLTSAILMALVFGGLFLRLHKHVGADNLILVLWASFIILLVLNALWLIYYLAYIRVRPVLFRSGRLLKPMMAFVMVSYLANLLGLLNYRFDVWYLQELRGASELGIYAVAVGVGQFFFQVPEPISRVLQPHLIGQYDSHMLDKFKIYSRLNFTVVLLGGIAAMLLSDWLFPFLYGEAFQTSALAFRWLMPGILFACASKMMAMMVIRTGKIGFNALASGLGLLTTVAMNVLLVPKLGLVGASIASTVAYLAVLLVVLWVLFFRLNLPWGNYYFLQPGDIRKLLRGL